MREHSNSPKDLLQTDQKVIISYMRNKSFSILAVALILMLLAGLTFSAYAGEKTTRILDKDDELTLYPMNHTGKYAASIAPAYPVRVECKATYQRNGKSTADIAEILTGISTIKGTQYYSQSKKEVTTLFTDAYTVDHPRHANRIEDHKLGNQLPMGIDIYGMLEDSRFKDNVYQFSYLFDDIPHNFPWDISSFCPSKI